MSFLYVLRTNYIPFYHNPCDNVLEWPPYETGTDMNARAVILWSSESQQLQHPVEMWTQVQRAAQTPCSRHSGAVADISLSLWLLLMVFSVPRIEPRTLCMLGKCSAKELHQLSEFYFVSRQCLAKFPSVVQDGLNLERLLLAS